MAGPCGEGARVAILALLIVPALVIEERTTDPAVGDLAHAANWVVWAAFCDEFIIRWAADGRRRFVRDAWFDLLLILVSPPILVPSVLAGGLRAFVRFGRSGCSIVRAGAVAGIGLRLARRVFGRRKFKCTALVAVAVVFLGAFRGVFLRVRGEQFHRGIRRRVAGDR